MSRRRAGGRGRVAATPALLLVLLLLVVQATAVAQGTPGATPSGTATSVAPLTPAEQRRADELRRVVRDALDADGDDADGSSGFGDLDVGGVGGVLWRLGIVVVVLLAVIVVIALVRRGPRARRREAAAAVPAGEGADDLERLALRAEQDGEHRAAVVLWFRAGTRGLLERRRIRGAGSATAGQVARAAGDDRVVALAVAHDRAAYGPGPVGADASRGAREGWAAVLLEAPGGGSDRRSGPEDGAGGTPSSDDGGASRASSSGDRVGGGS